LAKSASVSSSLILKSDSQVLLEGDVQAKTSTSIQVGFNDIPAGDYSAEIIVGSSFTSIASAENNIQVSLSVNSFSYISSIAGGRLITITGSGFYPNADKDKNNVRICGSRCVIQSSSATQLECLTPPFINPTVRITYPKLIAPTTLTGKWSADSLSALPSVTDGITSTFYDTYNNNCYIELDVGEDMQAEVSILPQVNFDTSSYIGAAIKGSNDGVTYETVFTLDSNFHQGWNYWKASENDPPARYRYLRYDKGTSSSRCPIAELEFYGIYLSANTVTDLNSVVCNAKIEVNGKSSVINNAVIYKSSHTPILDSISPEMGTSAGGVLITLSGTGFLNDPAKTKVYIDGVSCSVNSATTTQITCTTGNASAINYR